MSNGNEVRKLTKEEVAEILAENERLKSELAAKPKRGTGGDSKANYAKQKEREANDPEYAAKKKEARKAYQAKQKEKMANDPAFAEAKKAKQKAYRAKKEAELAEFRNWKASQGQA